MQDDEVVGFVAKVRLREGAMSKEQARAGALERLQRASTQHRKHLESVEQLEQDGTFSKEEADAERVRIGNERTAAKGGRWGRSPGGDDEGTGGAGGGAGGHVQGAGRGQHAVGVCDDGAGARGGADARGRRAAPCRQQHAAQGYTLSLSLSLSLSLTLYICMYLI